MCDHISLLRVWYHGRTQSFYMTEHQAGRKLELELCSTCNLGSLDAPKIESQLGYVGFNLECCQADGCTCHANLAD